MLPPSLTGLALVGLGLGLTLLVIAVLVPAIKQVECGFPSGVKITAALRDREDELRKAFATHKDDLGMSTHLLCDDPALATRLLGGLSVAQIAGLTERPPIDVSRSLSTAQALLNRAIQGGGPS